ncbi:AAA family ATPase [Loigolactobacillus bifermentans]|nr:AAA family ATPase [Loigolactobacillus bifermentans]
MRKNMWIKQLKIDGFGKWQQQAFTLTSGFNAFIGPNEAGKSTLNAFITGVLFGFATKKQPAAQYLPKTTRTYGGSLTLVTAQKTYVLKRQAGKAGGDVTLMAADGQLQPAALLAHLLQPVDQTLYQAIFELNRRELLTVANLSRTTLNQYLLAIGAIGSQTWLQRADDFERAAAHLYRPKGRVWPLNQALKTLENLEKQQRQVRQQLPAYQQVQRKLQQLTQQLTTAQQQQQQRQKALAQTQQLQQAWPNYQRYLALTPVSKQATVTLATYQDYQQLAQKRQQQQTTLQDLTQQLAAITQRTDQTPKFKFYLAHQAQFVALAQAFPVWQRTLLQWQEAKEQVQRLAAEQQQQTLPQAQAQALPADLVTSAQAKLRQTQALQQQFDQQQQTLHELQTKIAAKSAYIADLEQAQQPTRRQQQVTRRTQPTNTWQLGVGIGLIVIGFLLPHWLKIVSLVGLGLLGYYGLQRHRDQPVQAHLQDQWRQALTELDQLQAQAAEQVQRQAQLQQQLAPLQEFWRQLKQRYGYGELAPTEILAAQTAYQRDQQLTQQLTQQKQRFEQAATRLKQWQADLAFASDWLPVAQQTPEMIFEQVQTYVTAMQKQVNQLGQSDQRYQYLSEQLTQIQQAIKTTEVAQQDLLAQAHLLNVHELEQSYAALQAQNQQDTQREVIASALEPLLPALQQYHDLVSLETKLATQKAELAAMTQQLQTTQQQLSDQRAELKRLAADGTAQTLRQKIAAQQAQVLALGQQWLQQNLAQQWILATLNAASAQRFPVLLQQAQHYFAQLTLNRYDKISFNAETLFVRRRDGQKFSVEELSQGTAEQLYVALRLAFTQEIAKIKALPIIIDDGFVDFDQPRRQQMLKLLAEIAQHNQVIYFGTSAADLPDGVHYQGLTREEETNDQTAL